ITEQKEFEKRLFYAVIESEENERNRIAGELHDGVCQDLTVAKLSIEFAESMITQDNEKLKQLISSCRKTIVHTLNMTRKVSHQLMPKELFDRHFCDITSEMIKQLNQVDSIKYELKVTGKRKDLSPFVTINLYRIVQEFIGNSKKHSGTDRLSIDIKFSEDKLILSLKDFGKGFEMKTAKKNKGIGLLNIGKRVDGIGGSFRYDAKPGKGVELKICFPL
ncbi:MAG: sensor histidine kinase, partial [Flavisolibacter sp.]